MSHQIIFIKTILIKMKHSYKHFVILHLMKLEVFKNEHILFIREQ